jgi:hypothetical protein
MHVHDNCSTQRMLFEALKAMTADHQFAKGG